MKGGDFMEAKVIVENQCIHWYLPITTVKAQRSISIPPIFVMRKLEKNGVLAAVDAAGEI
jgi:hypothetical protein